MRISDWSSDVCSSDLGDLKPGVVILAAEDRRKDDRAGPRPPLVVAADDLAAAVFIGDRELGDQAQLAEGADEFLVPILDARSEEHTSELQSLMRNSYAVFCLKKKKQTSQHPAKLHKSYTISLIQTQKKIHHKYKTHNNRQ